MKLMDGVNLIRQEKITTGRMFKVFINIGFILPIIAIIGKLINIAILGTISIINIGISTGLFIIVIGVWYLCLNRMDEAYGYNAYLTVAESVDKDKFYNTYNIIKKEGACYIVYLPNKYK